MNNRFYVSVAALSLGVLLTLNTSAQDTSSVGKDLKNAGLKATKAVEKTANKVGNKTAEIASNSKSAVVDKVYAAKKGPNGEKIYIDGNSKYYYVDKKGHKQYVEESKLRDN